MAPSLDKLKNRLGSNLTSIELNPPVQEKLEEQKSIHEKHLKNLFDSVPEVGGINLPEIQEEEKKGDRGDRKSSFKKRVSPRKYASILSESFDKEFIINRVIVQVGRQEQEEWFRETYHDYDVQSVVVVGGESSDKTYPGPSVSQGNEMITSRLNEGVSSASEDTFDPTDFLVGNICISTRRRNDFDEPQRMAKKVKYGCDFFASQIIAEEQSPRKLLEDLDQLLRQKDISPPAILWSITPINSEKDVNFLRWLGVKIPNSVEERILGSQNPVEESLDYFESVWEKILSVQDNLQTNIPLGLNISPVAIRNLEPSIRLANRLVDLQDNQ